MTAGVQPTDPAVQAAIEAGARHSVPTPSLGIQCSCGADILTLAEREEHFTTVRVEAARPIIRAEYEAQIGGERLVHRLQEDRLREGNHPPRWEDDPIVIKNGWIDGRCTGCGELLPRAAVRTEPEK
jgi:hypothetical protein